MRNKCSQLRPSPVQASPDCPHSTSILLYSSQRPYLNLESIIRLLARPKTKKQKKLNSQWPELSVPIWLLTPYKSYLKGPTWALGSNVPSGPTCLPLPIDEPAGPGKYRVRSRPLMGKMTGVSDLSQKRPSRVVNRLSWMSSTGGRRAMVSVLEARRLVLQRGQYLKYCQPNAERASGER